MLRLVLSIVIRSSAYFGFVSVLVPGSLDTGSLSPPPFIDVRNVPCCLRTSLGVMEKGTKATEELCIDELSRSLPLKVFLIQSVILVKLGEVVSKLLGSLEVVNMNE